MRHPWFERSNQGCLRCRCSGGDRYDDGVWKLKGSFGRSMQRTLKTYLESCGTWHRMWRGIGGTERDSVSTADVRASRDLLLLNRNMLLGNDLRHESRNSVWRLGWPTEPKVNGSSPFKCNPAAARDLNPGGRFFIGVSIPLPAIAHGQRARPVGA
jgi:hypothetical protein